MLDMKSCIINETIVNNIENEINASLLTFKFKLDPLNIKTYTEQYVNSLIDISKSLPILITFPIVFSAKAILTTASTASRT
jgi:hypothetical protein